MYIAWLVFNEFYRKVLSGCLGNMYGIYFIADE